jgi:predicted nucleotidyltransferase
VTICYLLCRGKGMKKFSEFEAWCNRKKVKQITEEVVLVYIGGWKSTSVAEGYIENSIQNKINIAKKIQNQEVGNSFN